MQHSGRSPRSGSQCPTMFRSKQFLEPCFTAVDRRFVRFCADGTDKSTVACEKQRFQQFAADKAGRPRYDSRFHRIGPTLVGAMVRPTRHQHPLDCFVSTSLPDPPLLIDWLTAKQIGVFKVGVPLRRVPSTTA